MPVMPGARSAFGIGRENSPGLAVNASRFPPWSKFDASDKVDFLTDEGYRASMASEYGTVAGPAVAEVDMSGPGFVDSLGDLLHNILGDYAVGAAVSGVFPHTFGLLNSGSGQPPTHTMIDSQQLTATTGARVYPHTCLSELTLSGNAEGLFEVQAKGTAYPSSAAGSAMTLTPTTEQIIPAWRSGLTIAGVAAPNLSEWSVSIERELAVMHTADGTQAPYTIARGPLKVSGKLTLIALDESPLITGLLTNQQPALVLTVSNGGAAGALREVALTMTKAAYQEAPMKRDTLLGYDVSFKAMANSTDASASGGLSPIKAVVKNTVTTYA
ncbi:phage tail tube protein [Actinomadura hibisca]|uniref:phage tail tube protein n=1 Tax=Actinomadura hibisca TaxID=68565 RepID=UPI00082C87AE|nr:phage tail tube protein [Actinomadura hibisca]